MNELGRLAGGDDIEAVSNEWRRALAELGRMSVVVASWLPAPCPAGWRAHQDSSCDPATNSL